MDVGNLLAGAAAHLEGEANGRRQPRHDSIRPSLSSLPSQPFHFPPRPYEGAMLSPTRPVAAPATEPRPSPSRQQKQVTFELVLPEGQNRENRARLPMRIMISPHDTTDSIVTTVKNFYGLYDGPGLIFQDSNENILIASYDNFHQGMRVRVTITAPDPAVAAASARDRSITTSPRKAKLGAPFEMRPPTRSSRPGSRAAMARSQSPQSISGHRSASAIAKSRPRSRPHPSKDHASFTDGYADAYSDSDGGDGSVTSSRREAHVSAEISVNNIVEGGRRKRAKFDSSELPLFVPPQVPASNSISSVSPQRRVNGDISASPYASWSNQRTFSYPQPLPSPQSYTRPDLAYPQYGGYGMFNQGPPPRSHGPVTYGPPSRATGGILPTPEPTACSTISDEDVALQLMRLGDASNFSYGRTSTSTMDDALSGKAEAASSGDESEAGEPQLPPVKQEPGAQPTGLHRHKQHMHDNTLPSTDSIQSSEDEYEDGSFKGESDEIFPADYDETMQASDRTLGRSRVVTSGKRDSAVGASNRMAKSRLPGHVKSIKPRTISTAKVPMSPASLPSQSRKTSTASTINFQASYGNDEEDLSSKPRCQRCRKSKKGCDRQRPCGRCKDAGICADGCVSEDEGNGRKGRYGRHMGVPVKKDSDDGFDSPIATVSAGGFLTPAHPDKNKKRKR